MFGSSWLAEDPALTMTPPSGKWRKASRRTSAVPTALTFDEQAQVVDGQGVDDRRSAVDAGDVGQRRR